MNVQRLIDSIVRQATVLIAQLARDVWVSRTRAVDSTAGSDLVAVGVAGFEGFGDRYRTVVGVLRVRASHGVSSDAHGKAS